MEFVESVGGLRLGSVFRIDPRTFGIVVSDSPLQIIPFEASFGDVNKTLRSLSLDATETVSSLAQKIGRYSGGGYPPQPRPYRPTGEEQIVGSVNIKPGSMPSQPLAGQTTQQPAPSDSRSWNDKVLDQMRGERDFRQTYGAI